MTGLGAIVYLAGPATNVAATSRLRGSLPGDLVGIPDGIMLPALRSLR